MGDGAARGSAGRRAASSPTAGAEVFTRRVAPATIEVDAAGIERDAGAVHLHVTCDRDGDVRNHTLHTSVSSTVQMAIGDPGSIVGSGRRQVPLPHSWTCCQR